MMRLVALALIVGSLGMAKAAMAPAILSSRPISWRSPTRGNDFEPLNNALTGLKY